MNPFPNDPDRNYLWEMLVDRDIKAFLAADWNMVADDFIEDNFMGINAGRSPHPDAWQLSFPDLESYKTEWLKQARDFQATNWAEDPQQALLRVTTLRDIEIRDSSALLHKKFFGAIQAEQAPPVNTNWQTLYRCRKVGGQWKITGFVGYMPHILSESSSPTGISKPSGASQHATAGPYSPVLQVTPSTLVVISGQAAIDQRGEVIGATIEEQAAFTLDNCRKQLAFAGCTLDDVFKVNVYLVDLNDWPRFNEVYKSYFNDPLPVRTAVGSELLMTLKVEIEMWAHKS